MKNEENISSSVAYLKQKQFKHLLKQSQEYGTLGFGFAITAGLAAIIAICSVNYAAGTIKPVPMGVAGVLAAEALVLFLIRLAVKGCYKRHGELTRGVRMLGLLPVLMLATCNVFAFPAGCMMLKKKKSLEYHIEIFAILTDFFAIAVSCVNILKGYVISTFFPAIGILAVLTGFHAVCLYFLAEGVTNTQASRKMIPLAVLLILSGCTGNLFAVLAGLIVLAKAFNKEAEVSISWVDIFKRLFRSQVAVWGAFIIVFWIMMTFWANYTFDYSLAVDNNYQAILQGPSFQYPLGTDDLGRCVFSRVVFGAKISLMAGLLSTMFSVVIGMTLGAIAGYYSGKVDNVIMRILDVFMAMPGLLLPIAIVTATGNSIGWIIVALGMGVIPGYGRTVRASVMTLTGCEFIEAERANGAKNSWIILKHIIPNSLSPVIVRATMGFGGNVLAISSLSYLGVGIESYVPEWGNILKVGSSYLETASYLAIYPGVVIVLMVLGFNFLGDGVRDALDPKLK